MNFTPTKWSTVQDKEAFYAYFVRFVSSGFKASLFTKRFYEQLSNCFSHIAHFNRQGFYEVKFLGLDRQLIFFKNIEQYTCYGDPAFTYSDVEREIQKWVKDQHFVAKWTVLVNAAHDNAEKDQLAKLILKYPDLAKKLVAQT